MKRRILVMTMLFIITAGLQAQHQGIIRGKVIDKSTKQPLYGANIILIGTTSGAATDGNGFFIIDKAPENIYKLKISYIGYITLIKPDVRVIRNRTINLGEIELEENSIEGNEIVISAGAFESNKQQNVSYTTYTREEIWRAPGAAGDLFRAVEVQPGVGTSSGEFSAFSVRGGSPGDNVILIDNIPFDKVSHFEDDREEGTQQGGRFSVFPMGIIDKASFQGGGFPAQFGGKHSSVLDLTIKEGNRDDFTLRGHYDLLGWEATYDGPLYALNNSGLVLSLRNQDFRRILTMMGEKSEGYPKYFDAIMKFSYDPHPKHKISFLGLWAPERYRRTADNVFAGKIENDMIVNKQNNRWLAGINWRWLTGDKSYLQTALYHTYSNDREIIGKVYLDKIGGRLPTKHTAPVRDSIWDDRNTERLRGFKSDYHWIHGNGHTLSVGMDFQITDMTLNRTLNGPDTMYVFSRYDFRPDPGQKYLVIDPAEASQYYRKETMNGAFYLQYLLPVTRSFHITGGLRAEHTSLNQRTTLSPRISAGYTFSEKTSVHGAFGIYYQHPQMILVAANPANSKLKDERSVHIIAGLAHLLREELRFNGEVYYKTFSDLIVRPDRAKLTYTNAGTGYAAGMDLSLVKRFDDKFYGQVSYSYSISKRNDHDGQGSYNHDFHQPHMFNILAGYQFNKEWSVSGKWKYATGRPADSYTIHEDIFNNPASPRYAMEILSNNTRRMQDVHVLNLRIDYRKQFAKRFAVIAYLDVLNVYGRKNAIEESFIESTGKVETIGLTTMPLLGVKIEI